MSKKTRKYLHSQMALTKGGLPNSMIFRCSPLGLGVKQMKIIEFSAFRSCLKNKVLIWVKNQIMNLLI